MALLISTHQLEKSFAGKVLFSGVSLGIEDGDKVGLVGPNGAGKSTLLKILSGITQADGGKVTPKKGLRLGFLPQTPVFAEKETIMQALLSRAHDPDAGSTRRRRKSSDCLTETVQIQSDSAPQYYRGCIRQRIGDAQPYGIGGHQTGGSAPHVSGGAEDNGSSVFRPQVVASDIDRLPIEREGGARHVHDEEASAAARHAARDVQVGPAVQMDPGVVAAALPGDRPAPGVASAGVE